MAIQEGTRTSKFIVKSICPDVCKSPTAPAPYDIVGKLENSVKFSTNVNAQGAPVFHLGSRVATVMGDEAGVGTGLVSQSVKGYCKPFIPVENVRVNGQFVNQQITCYALMNGPSPEGPFNTIGQVIYTGAMFHANVGPSGSVPAGTNSSPSAETPAEKSFLDQQFDKLMADPVGAAQKAYGLATMDWSNPGAVLGAVGGLAGAAGLGQVAQAASLAQQGYGLATTDWSNPGAAMGAVMGVAGPILGGTGGGLSKGPDGSDELPPYVIMN